MAVAVIVSSPAKLYVMCSRMANADAQDKMKYVPGAFIRARRFGGDAYADNENNASGQVQSQGLPQGCPYHAGSMGDEERPTALSLTLLFLALIVFTEGTKR